MHRIAAATLAIVMATGALFTSASPVAACQCEFRPVAELAARVDVVALGAVAEVEPDGDALFNVEHYFKGGGLPQITIDNPDPDGLPPSTCDLFVVSAPKYLLFLTTGDKGFLVSPCSGSTDLHGFEEETEYVAGIQAYFDGPGALPESGGPPPQDAESEHKDLPWYIFLAGAFIVPLGVLYVGSFVIRRGPGGH